MLTKYFPELTKLKSRLDSIVNEELQRRSELGLPSPKGVELNLTLEETRFGGSPGSSDDTVVLSLNVLNEISQNLKLREKYGTELEQIDSWIVEARPIVAPDRINVTDNRLVDYLFHPEKFESVDTSSFDVSRKTHYQKAKQRLVETASRIRQYIETMMSLDVQNTDLNVLRKTVRHEIEHHNPEYKPKIDSMHAKENIYIAEFIRYKSGSRHLSTRWIRSKAREYLNEAAFLIPYDEARAYFCQFFDSENDTQEALTQKRKWIENHLVNEILPNECTTLIFSIVVKRFYMESLNRGEDFSIDALNYVQNIFYQGGRSRIDKVDSSKINRELADKLIREVSYWRYKFQEGIMNALNEVYEFYLGKLKE